MDNLKVIVKKYSESTGNDGSALVLITLAESSAVQNRGYQWSHKMVKNRSNFLLQTLSLRAEQ